MSPLRYPVLIYFVSATLYLSSCGNKEPYKPSYEISAAYVIGRENCYIDSSRNYWLLDLTVYPGTKQYGDTITYNGKVYTNVVKTTGLTAPFNRVGVKVGLDFTISSDRTQTDYCNAASPVTYNLREITIIHESITGD